MLRDNEAAISIARVELGAVFLTASAVVISESFMTVPPQCKIALPGCRRGHLGGGITGKRNGIDRQLLRDNLCGARRQWHDASHDHSSRYANPCGVQRTPVARIDSCQRRG